MFMGFNDRNENEIVDMFRKIQRSFLLIFKWSTVNKTSKLAGEDIIEGKKGFSYLPLYVYKVWKGGSSTQPNISAF